MSNRYFKVFSDNNNGELYSERAYRELRLQMGTGDFHTHRAKPLILDDAKEFWDVDVQTGEFYLVEQIYNVE